LAGVKKHTGGGHFLSRRVLAAIYFISTLSLAVAFFAATSENKPETAPKKEKLAVFRAETADHKRISSDEFFKDQAVVLLDFWALWCRDCIAFMPRVQDLKKKYGKDLLVVSVNTDTSQKAGEVASFIKARQYDFLVLLDPQQKVKQLLGVKMLPTMILASWDGTIAERIIGTPPKLEEMLDKRIADLLKERPAPKKEEATEQKETPPKKGEKIGRTGSH